MKIINGKQKQNTLNFHLIKNSFKREIYTNGVKEGRKS